MERNEVIFIELLYEQGFQLGFTKIQPTTFKDKRPSTHDQESFCFVYHVLLISIKSAWRTKMVILYIVGWRIHKTTSLYITGYYHSSIRWEEFDKLEILKKNVLKETSYKFKANLERRLKSFDLFSQFSFCFQLFKQMSKRGWKCAHKTVGRA